MHLVNAVMRKVRHEMGNAARAHFQEMVFCSILRSETFKKARGSNGVQSTHVTQDRTRHPGFPAVHWQLRLTCDQICTGSESLHVKYGAKEKKGNGNNWEP